ncbi:MAG: hypothetical protein M3370_03655 [Actinomycetota bacterium]|nr:hypothetical protein [Actinomycetota bacterium]
MRNQVMRDMYDLLPPARGATLRRRNKERLAQLEAQAPVRRARLARALRALKAEGRRIG